MVANKKLKAVVLLATLKHKRGGGEFSHTEVGDDAEKMAKNLAFFGQLLRERAIPD